MGVDVRLFGCIPRLVCRAFSLLILIFSLPLSLSLSLSLLCYFPLSVQTPTRNEQLVTLAPTRALEPLSTYIHTLVNIQLHIILT